MWIGWTGWNDVNERESRMIIENTNPFFRLYYIIVWSWIAMVAGRKWMAFWNVLMERYRLGVIWGTYSFAAQHVCLMSPLRGPTRRTLIFLLHYYYYWAHVQCRLGLDNNKVKHHSNRRFKRYHIAARNWRLFALLVGRSATVTVVVQNVSDRIDRRDQSVKDNNW